MRLRALLAMTAATALVAPVFAGGSKDEVRINLDQPASPPPKAAPTAPAASKAAPSKDTRKAAPKKDAKKADTPGKIEGMEVSRGDKGFLGVKIENSNFKISFYDKEKKPVTADVAGIVLRWPVHYQPNDERALLTPTSDGKAMTSDKVIKPPFSFKLFITLLKSMTPGEDGDAETYVIDFRQ